MKSNLQNLCICCDCVITGMLCRSLSLLNQLAFLFKKLQNNMSCKTCDEEYTSVYRKWCKPCQIDNLKGNFANWTSGNEKIDGCIQEMQLKIDRYDDIVCEWIPYNQFSDIKEIGRGGFATVYSAIWKDSPLLKYDKDNEE